MRHKPITAEDVFGRLTVTGEAEPYVDPKSGRKYRRWHVLCDCGNTKAVAENNLRSGRTTSCGCVRNDPTMSTCVTHRMSGTPEYAAWESMIRRCTSMTWKQYKDYGGRGITVCDEWLHNFAAFYAHVGPRPEGCYPSGISLWSLDRIENDGDYEPGNVRWATRRQQQENRRCSVHRVNA